MSARHALVLQHALRIAVLAATVAAHAYPAQAQTSTRLAVLQAENRRAPTAQDLNTLRVAARSADPETVRVAIRAMGRLERPSLVSDLLPGLRHRVPQVRAEAANAIAQALHGNAETRPPASAMATGQNALIERLDVEEDAGVRAAICEAVARLPYRTDADIARAESALISFAPRATSNTDRLGLAKGFEALARIHGPKHSVRPETIQILRELASIEPQRTASDALRDARVRRLALEALISLSAANTLVATTASTDPDPQVRRLAVRAAAGLADAEAAIVRGLTDPAPMVRIEALRATRVRGGDAVCQPALGAVSDPDMHVALDAIDKLAACGSNEEALTVLKHLAQENLDPSDRQWHRKAHARAALASAAPDLGATMGGDSDAHVPQHRTTTSWPAPPRALTPAPLTAAELRRLASPRARFTIRGLGQFDVLLFTMEAPATVLTFAQLAASGYYDGLTFHRVVPNSVVEGGSAAASELPGAAPLMRDEVGLWPHVRGALGMSTNGRDSGDGRIFINLVDNPQFDHTYTVFAQVLNGIDVVDQILEGDVIEHVEILP